MNGTKITAKSETEGPRHDPYNVRTYTVQRASGATAVLRIGMATSLRINGMAIIEDSEDVLMERFEAVAGCKFKALEKALHEVASRPVRFHKCGRNHMKWVSGHPGEELLVCGKCGGVLDYTFDISAVE